MKKILSIAGSDPSGGAGIQADIKTIAAHKMYTMSVITALTAQNTKGVSGVLEVPIDFIKAQIKAVFDECEIDYIKIGMLKNAEVINAIKDSLAGYKKIVLDPVMVATSGAKLLDDDSIKALKELMKQSFLITPNLAEAKVLTGVEITNLELAKQMAKRLNDELGVNILLKGGHFSDNATDILCENANLTLFEGEKIPNIVSHGTGCTLSSALACNLAKGLSLELAVKNAKDYVKNALLNSFSFSSGVRLLDHNQGLK